MQVGLPHRIFRVNTLSARIVYKSTFSQTLSAFSCRMAISNGFIEDFRRKFEMGTERCSRFPHAIGKSKAGCSYCPCREVLRLERFCRTGTKSPNSPIRAGKLHPQAGPGFPAGSDSGLFVPFEAYLDKNFRCTSRNRIPSF